MKAIILAAGYATRLYPLTENFPKPLLDVGGKPILDWLVEDLEGEVEEFIAVTNARFCDHFVRWAGDRNIRVISDGTTTNEGRLGAVRDILLAADGISGPALVMAGDNVLDFSLRPFIRFSLGKGTSCVMCHEEHRLEALQRTAVITMDGDDRILTYEEKPREPKGIYAVPPFYVYREEDLKRIPEALEKGCGFDAPGSFAAWLSRETPMHAYKMPGRRYDIGDRKSYDAIRESYRGIEK
ncbi:MAG: nucleotidyltransferase family protein [Clostridia bacterium]|nr:nucleotidyltransferase family protein [Clostridia bacterium]